MEYLAGLTDEKKPYSRHQENEMPPIRAASFFVCPQKCKNRGHHTAVFATRKEERKNEKEIIESFDNIIPRICEEKKWINIKLLLSYVNHFCIYTMDTIPGIWKNDKKLLTYDNFCDMVSKTGGRNL